MTNNFKKTPYQYFEYYDVDDWEIISRETFHHYDDAETPLEAVQVVIGQAISVIPNYTKNIKTVTNITRWISRGEYERLRKGCGQVIW